MLKVLFTLVVSGVYQYHSLLLLETATEQDILTYLNMVDRHDVQDWIDGVGSSRGRQSIPMEERFWNRVGRLMPSRTFLTLFRCM